MDSETTPTPSGIAELGRILVETKSLVTDLKAKQDQHVGSTGKASDELKALIGETQTRVVALESLKADLESFKSSVDGRFAAWQGQAGELVDGDATYQKTFGEALVTHPKFTEAVKALREKSSRESSPLMLDRNPLGAPGERQRLNGGFLEQKDSPLSTQATTRFAGVERMPMITPPLTRLRMRDVIPVVPIALPSVEFVREVGFIAESPTPISASITRSSQTATMTVAAHGIPVGKMVRVRVSGCDQAEYNGDQFAVAASSTTLQFTVTGSPATPATGTPVYFLLSAYGAAAGVAEGGSKPYSRLEFEYRTLNVQLIAHLFKVTRQALDDVPGLQAYIDGRGTYGLKKKEDIDLLYGSGTGSNIQGFLTDGDIQTVLWSTLGSGATKIDAVRKCFTRVEMADFEATAVVMHPTDWQDCELQKDDNGQYVQGPSIVVSGAASQLFRVPVVVSNNIVPGTSLIGAFSLGSQIRDRQQAEVRFFEQNDVDVEKNLLTVRVEERLAHVIMRPESYVQLSFNSAP